LAKSSIPSDVVDQAIAGIMSMIASVCVGCSKSIPRLLVTLVRAENTLFRDIRLAEIYRPTSISAVPSSSRRGPMSQLRVGLISPTHGRQVSGARRHKQCDITLIDGNAYPPKLNAVELSRADQSNGVTRELAQ
jgi:hypothetical protein